MEKATKPQPKTANNRLRQIITILLLSGGVFVLGFVWTIRYYHIFIDRVTPYVPESAELVVTIPLTEGVSPLWSAFDGKFGRTLSSIKYRNGATLVLFVDKTVDNDDVWHLMTNAPIDEESLPSDVYLSELRHFKILSPSTPHLNLGKKALPSVKIMKYGTGRGTIHENLLNHEEIHSDSIALPLRLSILSHAIKLEVGHRLRGVHGAKEFPIDARQITALPENLKIYTIIEPQGLPQIPNNHQLDSFVLNILKGFQTISEIIVTDNAFAVLLHANNDVAPRIETIEQPIIAYLSQLKPKEVSHILPDGGAMTELRTNIGEVTYRDKSLPNDILLRTYSSEDGREISLISESDGRMWITDQLHLVSSLIVDGGTFSKEQLACQPSTSTPGSLFSESHIKDIPTLTEEFKNKFSLFKLNSIRIDDKNTKLFTFCGYF